MMVWMVRTLTPRTCATSLILRSLGRAITVGAAFFFNRDIDKPISGHNSAPNMNFGLPLEIASEDYQWTLRDFPEAVPLQYCIHYPVHPCYRTTIRFRATDNSCPCTEQTSNAD